MTGLHFWSTGYCVSTVGLDEGRIRAYIREQEQLEDGARGPGPEVTSTSRPRGGLPHVNGPFEWPS